MMKRKLDAARIEEARRTTIKSDTKEAERREIQETISKNRRGERKVKVILPDKKPYAYQESKRIRVAAYCRVSTAEEAQMNSFEMQVQHFEQVISENPMYEKADIYKDEGISGTSIEKRKDFQRMIEDCPFDSKDWSWPCSRMCRTNKAGLPSSDSMPQSVHW